MSRIGRALAHTMASRMMVSSLSCRVSPDVDQFVEPDTRHRPSTITIFRCMIALFSDVSNGHRVAGHPVRVLRQQGLLMDAAGLALIQSDLDEDRGVLQ